MRMRAVVVRKPGELVLEDIPEPEPDMEERLFPFASLPREDGSDQHISLPGQAYLPPASEDEEDLYGEMDYDEV